MGRFRLQEHNRPSYSPDAGAVNIPWNIHSPIMKKTLFTSLLAASMLSTAMAYTESSSTTGGGGLYSAGVIFSMTEDYYDGAFLDGDAVALTNITLTNRYNSEESHHSNNQANDYSKLVLALVNEAGELIGTSEVVLTTVSGNTAGNLMTMSFNFDSISINVGEQYKAIFVYQNEDSSLVNTGSSSITGGVGSQTTSTAHGDWKYLNLNGQCNGSAFDPANAGKYTVSGSTPNGMSVSTEALSVPEPSTATLSLLALTGLMLRRRRKA